jgi:hypothetical protein
MNLRSRPARVFVAVGWLLLAAYVLVRGFMAERAAPDVILAAWAGGVLSMAGFILIWVARRDRRNRLTSVN